MAVYKAKSNGKGAIFAVELIRRGLHLGLILFSLPSGAMVCWWPMQVLQLSTELFLMMVKLSFSWTPILQTLRQQCRSASIHPA